MTDKQKLEPLFRAYNNGDVDIDETITYILKIYTSSKRINISSVIIGVWIQLIISLIYIGIKF